MSDWIKFLLPCILFSLAIFMLWQKRRAKGKSLEVFKIVNPPNRHAVEQLVSLQEAISNIEANMQAGNIVLLKLRTLLFASFPQATDTVVLSLIAGAAAFAFVPLKYLIMLAFLEIFTREMPLRRLSSDRVVRRLREWWVRIPAAPVELIRTEDKKRK